MILSFEIRLCICVCLCCTVLGGEERGLGAWRVFRPWGHQLDRSNVFIGQLPQGSLSVLDHLLHCCMLLKCFPNLDLTETEREGERERMQRQDIEF